MNEALNINNNDFFYKKDKGSNENAENEVNHLINKSKRKAYTIYILQILVFVSIILTYIFSPAHFDYKESAGKIVLFSLLFGFSITIIVIAYMFMIFEIFFTDEYLLLSSKRDCKGIVEVLQDYFYKSPSEVFHAHDYDYKSWIDISGILSIEDNSADKLYLILFIKPNIQKYDRDGKLGNVEFNIYSYESLKHYVKIGNNEPSFFNYGYFIFFSTLGLVGFYLFYIRCYIKLKEFTVKKILNAKDDLNTMKQNIGYDKYIPGISINGKQFLYDSNLTGGNRENIAVVPNNTNIPNNAEIELNYKVKVNL